jgi:hypothetical protein
MFETSLHYNGAVIPVLLQAKVNYVIIRNLDKASHKITIEATAIKDLVHYFLVFLTKE